MDDPWGSPWAEENPAPPPAINPVELKASVKPERSPQFNRDSKSPWDDVVEFGEWASLPNTEDVAVVVEEAAPGAISEDNDVIFNKESVQRIGEGSDDGRLGWDNGDGGSFVPGYASLQTPKLSARQPSPDPWVVKDSNDDEIIGKPGTAQDLHKEISVSKNNITPESAKELSNEDPEEEPRIRSLRTGFLASVFTEVEIPARSKTISIQEPGSSTAVEEEESNLPDGNTQGATHGELSVSRPSSSPSDQSRHGEVLAESPRTSFEDEEKPPKFVENSPVIIRTVASDRPHEAGQDARLQDENLVTHKGSCAEDDILVKEVLQLQTESESPTKFPPLSMSYDTSKLSNKMSESSVGSKNVAINESVIFQTDLQMISQLFGEEVAILKSSNSMSDEIPDLDVFHDSFSSTEQRKTWYRISRFGPMRKYNTGDEDNYLRINWKDSNVRKDTLQIVARWREEDISGGVILGGGGRPASIFGWGQKNAAPMSIAAALASKRGSPAIVIEDPNLQMFPRTLDTVPMPIQDSPQNSTDPVFSSRDKKLSPTSIIAPQFSWSTGMPASATAEMNWKPLSAQQAPSQKFSELETLQAPGMISSIESKGLIATSATNSIGKSVHAKQPPPSAVTSSPILRVEPRSVTAPPINATALVLDEADDWGEMVSTPSLVAPSFKASTGPGFELPESLPETTGSTSGNAFASIEPAHGTKPNAIKDVWAATDFSFFDAPVPALPPKPPQATLPTITETYKPEETPPRSQGESKDEVEQIRLVKSIVKNLPDLSYMLRR